MATRDPAMKYGLEGPPTKRAIDPRQPALSVDLRPEYGHPGPDESAISAGFSAAFELGGELVGEIRVLGPGGREVRLVAALTGRPGVVELQLPDELSDPARRRAWRDYLGA